MKIDEVNKNLGKIVHYTDRPALIDHDFKFTAYIQREGEIYQAELQCLIQKKSVIIVPLEEVQVKTV